MIRAAILTPAPDYHEAHDWALGHQAAALEAAGIKVHARVWTEPSPEAGVDLVLPLVAWGYHQHAARWHRLLDRLEAAAAVVVNPVPLLRWNSDKAYLGALADAGVATVPTLTADALDEAALAGARARFDCAELVVKPPVSAGADGTFRLAPGEAIPAAVAGRRMLVQPFQRTIATDGELSLMLFGGRFSHAVVKRAKPGDFRVQPHLGGTEQGASAPPDAIALAQRALAAAPAAAAYARVDLVGDGRGGWLVMELELIEPALWLDAATGSGARFGAAVRAAAEAALGR